MSEPNDYNEPGTTRLSNTDFEETEPKWGTARFNARMFLELLLRDSGERMMFDSEEIDELLIGRYDPITGVNPHIDLEPHGALNKGVSRRHASIVRREGSLSIVDHGSPNGTFLNGQKLVPEQPRVLRDGDDIRLGHLTVRVTFKNA